MKSQQLEKKKKNLPDSPGVYFFIGSGSLKSDLKDAPKDQTFSRRILYIGKATSLRDRVKSYFAPDILGRRGPFIAKMVEEIKDIKFIQTDSVLEALILEVGEIKKYQPHYNSREKDDKSHNYVVITKEDFPRILVVRGSNIRNFQTSQFSKLFGPFPHATELREALKIIRRIFPYRDERCKISAPKKPLKSCFPAQLGLCPGPCAGWISKIDYRKNIKRLTLFFESKKDTLIRELEREMNTLAKAQKFEEAGKIKRQLFALDHIQDVALIRKDSEANRLRSLTNQMNTFRIEAYDIAHLSGKETVGVMTVIENHELLKSQYRKFKIRADKNDDVANLKEIITRRFGHPEWRFPDLIVVDGGVAQINIARDALKKGGLNIGIVSVVKDSRHKASKILNLRTQNSKLEKSIFLANSEAHRFAIKYHRLLRRKGFRI
jgi:excinuclease ABC subunit C